MHLLGLDLLHASSQQGIELAADRLRGQAVELICLVTGSLANSVKAVRVASVS